MSISQRFMDGHFWNSSIDSYANRCKQSSDHSKDHTSSRTEGNNPHDSTIEKTSDQWRHRDLGHVVTQWQLADCLTKSSIKPDTIIQSAETGILPYVDASPEFRRLLQHKAYLVHWCAHNLKTCPTMLSFLGEDVSEYVQAHFSRAESLSCYLRFDPSPSFQCYFTKQIMAS